MGVVAPGPLLTEIGAGVVIMICGMSVLRC